MKYFNSNNWSRIEFDNLPIYFHKSDADWFVPNNLGDDILRDLCSDRCWESQKDAQQFLMRLPDRPIGEYIGRSQYLEPSGISELWFHITDHCNLSCRHCLFSCSPIEKREISFSVLRFRADEAYRMGCRLFCLTGGEPFLHPQYKEIIRYLLSFKDVHVVTLTNATMLKRILSGIEIDRSRFHLQVSIDGLEHSHDMVRGEGSFEKVKSNLLWLKDQDFPYTVAMCITQKNVKDIPLIVNFASDMGAGNVHYMWMFVKGRAKTKDFVHPQIIYKYLIEAQKAALHRNIKIDNIEALRSQIFAPSGTLHDGTTSAWQSAAIGPDDRLYPSAAMIDTPHMGTSITEQGLSSAYHESSLFKKIRNSTISGTDHPLRFFLGGGDFDHSFFFDGSYTGSDPYLDLYEKIILWLIKQNISEDKDKNKPGILLKMGEILDYCGSNGRVSLTHSNCLLATMRENSLLIVQKFYSDAAKNTKMDILNPVCYPEERMSHIPSELRFRGYGCGSPVLEANIGPGESVMDLGCGRGIECFIASKIVGEKGRVIGIDMLDNMLDLGDKGKNDVSKNLGYDNITFKKGYLEALPHEDESVDVVLSNCVMNLSTNKRLAYAEILRVLKKGGRLVISDVVCDTEPPAEIRNDKTLQGECIAGAMTQKDLNGILQETGFNSIFFIKRFFYREVKGHKFYSLTYMAYKKDQTQLVPVIYRGPLPYIETEADDIIVRGSIARIPKQEAEILKDHIFLLDDEGNIMNRNLNDSGGCCSYSEKKPEKLKQSSRALNNPKNYTNLRVLNRNNASCCSVSGSAEFKRNITVTSEPVDLKIGHSSFRRKSGCMVCGSNLKYSSEEKKISCFYCGNIHTTGTVCINAHFVCNKCHQKGWGDFIEQICLKSDSKDLIDLFTSIRKHPSFPLHGPEHHMLVPAVILSVYRNSGGSISEAQLKTGIKRGGDVSGGSCGFMGICGAAMGVGMAFSLIVDANPVKPKERQIVQMVTAAVLSHIANHKAARCCQREVFIALKSASVLSDKYLDLFLRAEGELKCLQKKENKECLGADCPLW